MVAHTTQQKFVIGQFQTKNKSHWSRHFHGYLNQYLPLPNNSLTTDTPHTDILNKHLKVCVSIPWCVLSMLHYNVKVQKIQSHFVCGSHSTILINFNAYVTVLSTHTFYPMYVWKSTSLFPQKPMAM